MSQANEVEQLMLELINEERTSIGLDPLKIKPALNETAEDHSQWMLDNDVFDHTGAGGSSSGDRIAASYYDLEGSWRTAENVGWQSERGAPGIADDVSNIHESLMNSPNHRANILNPDLEDIGIGIETGDFNGFDAVMVTQNFGRTEAISDAPEEQVAPVVTSEGDAPVVPVDMVPDVQEDAPSQSPVEKPEDERPTSPTGTPTSSSTVTATSGPDGPSVDIDGEGDFTATGTATTGDETVTETATGGSQPDPVPDEGGAAPMPSAFVASAFLDAFFDRFDFAEMPVMDAGETDAKGVTAFEGAISTPEGTFTTSDPVAFDAALADMVGAMSLPFGDYMDFC